MIHLMKLELKKIHFGRYILISAFAIVLSMYFVFVSLNDTSDNVRTFEDTFKTVEMIFAFIFVIFFSVLNAALVISEYNNKTILLMFTYPVDKKKIILSKLLFITLFMAVSMLIGYVFCSLFIIGIDKKFDLLAGDFSTVILKDWLSGAFVTTIVFCCLGLLTFAVGMIRKSVSVTIVSSMIFIFLRQVVITAGERNRENFSLVFMTLAITLAAMWYTFAKKITQLD